MVTTDAVRAAIVDYIADTGRTPKIREIAYRLDVRSLGTVYGHVRKLRVQGFLVDSREIWPARVIEAMRIEARAMSQAERMGFYTAHTGGDA
jgi:hypothetical protein